MGHTGRPGTQSNTLELYHAVTDWGGDRQCLHRTGLGNALLNIAPGSGRWPRKGTAPRAIPVTSCYSHPAVLLQLWPLGTHACSLTGSTPDRQFTAAGMCADLGTQKQTPPPPSWIDRAQDRFRPPQGPTGYHHPVHGHDREPWQDGCYMLPPVPQ